MITKPEGFQQRKCWTEKISPEKLDSFIRYVWAIKRETEANEKMVPLSEAKVQVFVDLFYAKDDPNRASISVNTIRGGISSAFYVIALFDSTANASETFYEYVRYKNVQFEAKGDDDIVRQVIEVKFES